MITLIKHVISFLSVLIISLFFTSCNIDINYDAIKAEGEVVTETRTVGTFNKIKASQGLKVILNNGEPGEVKVQANENLHDIIVTEVKDNVLYIKTEKNIRHADAKNIMVTIGELYSIDTSSGSTVISHDEIRTSNINLEASSGSNINISVNAKNVDCDTSSGSRITLSGSSNSINASSSSGSSIRATQLTTNQCDANSSSGSSIKLNCEESITAKASSGSSIRYDGTPKQKTIKKSSGASIKSI